MGAAPSEIDRYDRVCSDLFENPSNVGKLLEYGPAQEVDKIMSDWITISKLLPQLLYPLNLVLVLLILSLFLLVRRKHKLPILTLFLAVSILLLSSSPLSTHLYRRHEQQYLPKMISQLPTVDAIVMLGGDVGLPLFPRVLSEIRGNRALHTLRLYQAGKAKLIFISGGNAFPQQEVHAESTYIAALLKQWGVSVDSIIVESKSRNTHENAKEINKLMEIRGFDKVLLVTSAFHMPRALATFRTVGIDAIPAPSDYSVVDYSKPIILDWIPSISNLGKLQAVIREKLGILVYRYRGWIS